MLLACWSTTSVAISQETLDEKKARAAELFKDKKWSEAESLYASIISDSPKSHDLNFRYGTCLIYGSKNIQDAIPRLRYAVTGAGIDARAYYYLGRAYHLNYQFNDALKQYNKFKDMATPNLLKDLDVETDIKACTYGKRLLSTITDMVVIQKTELNADNFYDLYKLDDIGGTLLVTDVFQTKLDKKRNHRPIIHFPSESPYIYYSSYGDKGETGLDIYVKKKLPGGEWSLAQKVRGQVNTDKDEDFAYMHPNGQYLYFCSKGHNSMGGYDVFRSKYNVNDQSFGPPENMDFAISSPDDDLLFVVDSLDRTAYFSSARESSQGKLTVYKVRVDRIPMQLAVVKGNFFNSIENSEREVEIEVEDFSSGQIIGKFNSKKTNGDYLITFPKSGKYKFYITPKKGEYTHGWIVEVPASREFKPWAQTMTLEIGENGEEVIKVSKLSDDVDDPVAVMAEVYRQLSVLPPNADDYNLDSLDALKETDGIFVDAGLDPFITTDGVEAILIDEIEDLTYAVEEEQKQANIAFNLGLEKSDLANEKMVELNALIRQAENTSDPLEKDKLLQEVRKGKQEVADLNNESQSLIDLAETIEASVADKQQKIDAGKKLQNDLAGVADGDRTALTNFVKNNQEFFEENVKGNPAITSAVTEALENGADEQKRVQELSAEISEISKSKRTLEKENLRLEQQMANEKKKKVIDELQRKIDENDSEIAVLEASIDKKTKALDKALNDNDAVRDGIAASLILKDNFTRTDYEKELTQAEKQSVIDKVKSNNLEESLAIVDEVLEANNVSAFNIDLYANDEQTSSYSLEDWNDAIDKEKERLRQEKLKASEERQRQIQAEIDRLEKLRQEKIASYTIIDEDPTAIDPDVSEDQILTNYTKRKNSIGEIVNEGDRRKANVDLNTQLLDEVQKERKKVEQLLVDNPKAKNLKERLANLERIENEIKSEINRDQEWIVQNETSTTFNKDEVVTNLDPDYQQNVNLAYEIVDEEERNKAINDLNEIILQKANERTQELEAILTDDPENKKAQDELTYLEEFIDNVNSNKSQPLVEPESFNVDALSADVAVEDLMVDYESRKAAIDAIQDEYERKTAENKLYQEVINQVRNELARMDQLAEQNPDNDVIEERQKALQSLDRDFNKSMAKNQSWLDKNTPTTPVYADKNLVNSVYPEYQAEIDRASQMLDDGAKKDAIENLNETALEKIENRLSDLEALISQDPDNLTYYDEREELENLEKFIKKNKTQALIEPTDPNAIQTDPKPFDLMVTYDQQLESINQSRKSELEKEKDRVALNEDLLARINTELNEIENGKAANPDQIDALNQRESALDELKTETQSQIDASNATIDELENETAANNRPTISVGNLMPDYERDLGNIRSSNKSEKEKLEEENNLHKMLIAAVDYKIAVLNEEKAANPDLSDVINKEIETLNEIMVRKNNLIDQNEAAIPNADTEVVETRPLISVGALKSDYESDLTDIRNGEGTDIEKLEKENEVHQELIDLTDSKIEELKQEREEFPENAVEIDEDIAKLENIKRSTQNSININNDQLAQLGANELNRPSITIGTLVSDFDDRMAAIENSDATDIEKLEQRNALNRELLNAIENKLSAVQEEWEEDPNNGYTYNQEIDKLEELKEAKQSEIARTNDEIAELEGNIVEVSEIKPTDFSTDEGRAAVAEFDQEITEIEELNRDIADLTDQLNTSTDEKERAKLQKNLNKANENKAEIENKVIEGLADANSNEIELDKSELETDRELTQNASASAENGLTEELRTAEEYLIIADQKLNEARRLRDQAEDDKDPITANEKLKEAFQLETEAKDLVEEARRKFKMARALNEYASDEPVIIDVPENTAERKSTEKFDEAAELREIANTYYDRAKELRDSSETVKKKFKDAVLIQADAAELKGDALNSQANDIESEAENLQTQENEFLANQIDEVDKTVDEETTESIATSALYDDYYAQKNEGDQKLEEANEIETEITELKNTRTRKFKMAVAADPDDVTSTIESDPEISENQAKIDSLRAAQKRLRDEALANYANAKAILSSQDETVQEDIIALEQNDVKPYEKVEEVNTDFEVPDNVTADIFRTTDNSIYSDDTPIPVSEKQPSGLVYKIQVGAFRKPLPQDHFKEFAPISGEKLNNGITRYMVGYFTTFDPANEAKRKVNGIGYGDAFVVAYCNGERITIDRARLIEQGLIACEGTDAQDQNDNLTITDNGNNTNTDNTNQTDNTDNQTDNTNTNNQTDNQGTNNDNNNTTDTNTNNNNTNTTDNTDNTNTSDNTTTTDNNTTDNTNNTLETPTDLTDQSDVLEFEPETAEERQLVNYYTGVPNAADANQVEIIDGLFYTVQIGVYSKPVPNSALFNIQPLNSQRTEGGYIRYSTGIFTSEEAATIRKDEVVQIGVADAFVTAYFEGERITPEEALQILIREGAEVLVGNKKSEPETNTDNTDNNVVEEKEQFFKEGLHYRVLIGTYEEAIPGEYATLLLQGDGIFETEVDQDGNTALISSKLDDFDELIDRLNEFADLGIEDMDILTYYKYDVIPFEEGEKIRNDQEIDELNPYENMEGISANKFVYTKEAVYFKVKLGEFEDKVPADFTNLLLLHEEEENINKEETIDDETIFTTGSIENYEEAQTTRLRLVEKGFDRAIIVAYHKYDEISIEKAREILEE